MLVPVFSGSDKTTVSVATGHQEYHPVYLSVGNYFQHSSPRSWECGHACCIPTDSKKYAICFIYIPDLIIVCCSEQTATEVLRLV